MHRALIPAILLTTALMTCAEPIPIEVLEPVSRPHPLSRVPVAVGLLFPRGELTSVPGGRLLDRAEEAVPFEAEVTGWWDADHTSIKWLLLHFRADTEGAYTFVPGPAAPAASAATIARLDGDDVVVDTGPLKVRLRAGRPALLDDVRLRGAALLQPGAALRLVVTTAAGPVSAVLADWRLILEETTPSRAVAMCSGTWTFADGRPIADLQLRYRFFRDEAYVQLYHTLTWRVRDPAVGIRELSLAITTAAADNEVMLGEQRWDVVAPFRAWQDAASHYRVQLGDELAAEGERLPGWIDKSGVAVVLRHPWQTFPTAFAAEARALRVELQPPVGEPLSFLPEGIMPPDFFESAVWQHFWWSQAAGHYVNEYATRQQADGTIVPNRYFDYTAEGAALTHELVIFCHDATSRRTAAEVNSLIQEPLVLRQDPVSAMRVPFMGFQLSAADDQAFPEIERAVDRLGRMALARWPSQHNYGQLRFGSVIWGRPLHPNTSLYRWLDNLQYDQQLIPWLLFMRGGDRQFFEDGEITARYAMDINVNHFNTRGFPTGYCATCGGGLPFPFLGFMLSNMKATKIHYLAYYYHLTGYRRAKEVMDEVIAGTKAFVLSLSDDPASRHSTAREIYNMNMFWASAWQETHDPQIAQLAAESAEVMAQREYDAELNTFRQPQVYLYNGLVMLQRELPSPALREVMLRHLGANLLPHREAGGVASVADVIGAGWAYDQTQDRRYGSAAWDVAKALANLTPDADFAAGQPLDGCISGNSILRHFLLPILVGSSLAKRLGLQGAPTQLDGTYFYLGQQASGPLRLDAWVRCRRDGELALEVDGRTTPEAPITVATNGADEQVLAPAPNPPHGRFYPRHGDACRATIAWSGLHAGDIVQVVFTGSGRPRVRLRGDADIVYRFPAGQRHGIEPVSGGQIYSGSYLYTRAAADEITVTTDGNIFHRPFVVRDAGTGELLHRYALGDALTQRFAVGAGRRLEILFSGNRVGTGWTVDGVAPYFSTTADAWFDPEAPE